MTDINYQAAEELILSISGEKMLDENELTELKKLLDKILFKMED